MFQLSFFLIICCNCVGYLYILYNICWLILSFKWCFGVFFVALHLHYADNIFQSDFVKSEKFLGCLLIKWRILTVFCCLTPDFLVFLNSKLAFSYFNVMLFSQMSCRWAYFLCTTWNVKRGGQKAEKAFSHNV